MQHSVRTTLFPGAKHKAVTLSYDDGTIHDRRLVEIFNLYGLRGTFHLNSGFLGNQNYINADEVAPLFAGHEVSAHSVTHPHLETLPPEAMAHELLEDRRTLESLVGYAVRGMSYPFGSYDTRVLTALPHYGIEYARTTQSHGGFQLPDDFLRWHPTCHHAHDLEKKTETFLASPAKNRLQLLYVWGHSYEFDRNSNWELIENFGKQIAAARDDVWLATNIEIKDYCDALRRLRTSVSGDIVHNLSHLTLWVSIDGEPREIAPGQTLKF
ncbi:polysaccharide deacetylase [bacterium]|nr:MAG: polysaccharide deacetylase [bacterium]